MSLKNINWDEVKAYYLTCRSYKKTAARFGLKVTTVNTRASREKWAHVTGGSPKVTLQGDNGASEAKKDMLRETSASSNKLSESKNDMQHEASASQNELSEAKEDRPHDGSTSQNESSEVKEDMQHDGSTSQNELSEAKNDLSDAVSTLHPQLPLHLGLVGCFPTLPCIPNLTCRNIRFLHPWNVRIVPHGHLPNKAAYRSYIQNPETQDCLLSGVLGESPEIRVSADNPPARLCAIVADYDTVLTPEKREKMLARLNVRPNFVSRSFSGGTHAVWFLEKPLPVSREGGMLDRLLSVIRKELKLANAFGPLDTNAYANPSQFYHAGWDWRMVHEDLIPEERCLLWLMDAASKMTAGSREVPLDVVAQEVEARFPGRWKGVFVVGARGVRFWDSQADNPTAAIVTARGMLCFTGPFPWRSWEDIFGKDFLAQYRADTLGKVLRDCYFVNNMFYVKGEFQGTPCWQTYNRQNVESLLAKRYGLRSRPSPEDDQSEVRDVISSILDRNTLTVARPFIYNRDTVVYQDGVPILNTSLLRVHPPDKGPGKHWAEGFPWTAAFIESLFPDQVQLERFICEWAYAYRHAFAGKPRNGRVAFIAGDVGVGKNFLTECLIGPSLGGFTDPSAYLLGHTRFNDSLFSVGAWVCNDTVVRGDERERKIFTASLKRMAANVQHTWEGKYKGSTNIAWSGRVYVTLNTDPVSMQLLPDLDLSNRDKISLYRVSGPPMDDPSASAKAKAEMGALCSYLLHMDFPEHCRDGERWGVRNYLHPELLAEAVNSGSTASFAEILMLFCKDMFEADPCQDRLDGPATWFLQKMLEQPSLREMLRGCESPRSFGRHMSTLSNTGAFPVHYYRSNTSRRWCVERSAFEQFLRTGNKEGELDELFPF